MGISTPLAAVAVVILGLLAAPSAHAYLDPGTGSFILQSLVAGALAAMVYFRLAWAQTKLFFRKLFGGASGQTEEDLDSAEKTEHEDTDR